MPFPDEIVGGVEVLAHRASWADEGRALCASLAELVADAVAVEHIGSTSVPGMAAKDCLDVMIVVDSRSMAGVGEALERAGYRRRLEEWNRCEPTADGLRPKQVFAPPVGSRPVNVHVRPADSAAVRTALLFRDFLRARPSHTADWSELKSAVAGLTSDLASYGSVKLPAWRILMALAERWSAEVGWQPGAEPTA